MLIFALSSWCINDAPLSFNKLLSVRQNQKFVHSKEGDFILVRVLFLSLVKRPFMQECFETLCGT